MIDFDYVRATSLDEATAKARAPGAMLLAGGTTLLDLAKSNIAQPNCLIDIGRLPGLRDITEQDERIVIGALATMSHVAANPLIRAHAPAIEQSLLLAASAQLRNMATIGGNLLQRTRCAYFRDPAAYPACNKRLPGSGCSADGAVLRDHAILGGSPHCVALYPGDLAVALTTLDATVHTTSREIPIDDLFVVPGTTPQRETILEPGEIITAVSIRRSPATKRSVYLKVRDRASYEFASASAAVWLDLEADGRTIRDLRVALGGVATRPWRAAGVEAALRGQQVDETVIRTASRLAVECAQAAPANTYKIDLAPRVVARAILAAGALS
jgi:xanthine dehydrogenase YagS FAD-binding subunit